MHTLLYDSTFDGLLTAIFTAYEIKAADPSFSAEKNFVPNLLNKAIKVNTDPDKAARVANSIAIKISPLAFELIFQAFLSEVENTENHIYHFIRNGLQTGKSILNDLNRPEVNFINDRSKSVTREKHLFLGIIRFRQLKDNSYYASIEPAYNILPLIGAHFKSRFGNQNWIIHDLKRQTALICLEKRLSLTEVIETDSRLSDYDSFDTDLFDGLEEPYQKLWQEYFRSIAITERKNPQLQMHFIPKKYWRHLIEKQ